MFTLMDIERSLIEFSVIMTCIFIFTLSIPNIASYLEFQMDEYISYLRENKESSNLDYKYQGLEERVKHLEKEIEHLEKLINTSTDTMQLVLNNCY